MGEQVVLADFVGFGDVSGSVMEYVIGNRIRLFRSITIIYILYFYLIGAGIMPNLTAIATASLCAHFLRRRLAVPTTTTLLFSN
jgi:hypothetical protein